jgi:succinate-semialdehyde dehydrogenase / glutarate-semialdehyde dehydrogenase
VGNGLDQASDMGPLANARRPDAVGALIGDALAKGATRVVGGERIGNAGNFHQPTLLADVPGHADIMSVEPFGPVAVTQRFDDFDAVVAAANAVPFGLAAFAFTENGRRANMIADALEVGMVGVNSFNISGVDTPFGGVKQSGFGREGGAEGIASYCITKAVHLA